MVFSHTQNSFDKKELLDQGQNPYIHETPLLPTDFVKEPEILKFFMEDIDKLLDSYNPGNPEHKKDVNKQLAEIKESREVMMKEHMQQQQEQMQKQAEYADTINKIQMLTNPKSFQTKINEQSFMIKELLLENEQLKEKTKYLEDKIKQLITEKIQEKIKEKNKLLQLEPNIS